MLSRTGKDVPHAALPLLPVSVREMYTVIFSYAENCRKHNQIIEIKHHAGQHHNAKQPQQADYQWKHCDERPAQRPKRKEHKNKDHYKRSSYHIGTLAAHQIQHFGRYDRGAGSIKSLSAIQCTFSDIIFEGDGFFTVGQPYARIDNHKVADLSLSGHKLFFKIVRYLVYSDGTFRLCRPSQFIELGIVLVPDKRIIQQLANLCNFPELFLSARFRRGEPFRQRLPFL